MPLFDSHCHLQFSAYDQDRQEVIKRTLEAGIWLVNIGTNKITSQKALDLVDEARHFFASVGLHPAHTNKIYHDENELVQNFDSEKIFDYEFYKSLAKNDLVVAIGECGLDYFGEPDKQAQVKILESQITLANELKKPLMIHCRNAYDNLYEILKIKKPLAGANLHFFKGTKDQTKNFLDLGCYLSFAGPITFKNAKEYEDLIVYVPLERILVETDSPYVSPEPFRGQRNEPGRVEFVVKKIAQIKKINEEKVISQTFQNAVNFFKISSE